MTKRILVFGGTGRTGQHVVEKALAAGLLVNVLARKPESMTQTHPNLVVFKGTPENTADIAPAIAGCDAVLATMNNARASDSPFAKIINSPTLLSDCFANIITEMKRENVSRIVQLGAMGAADSYPTAPWVFRQFIKRTNLGVAYRDHEGVEAALAASDLDWTVGRAVGLGKKSGVAVESIVKDGKATPKPSITIGRKVVAQWMIDAIDRRDLFGQALIISAG